MNQQTHLNEDQFTALLTGEELADARAHLDSCVQCREEFEQVSASMESFSGLSLEWAERKAATMPPVPAAEKETAWVRPLVWTSVMALMALGLYTNSQHKDVPTAVAQSGSSSQPTNGTLSREQQIEADNRLLLAIQQELSQPDPVVPASIRQRQASGTISN